jgi:hypothetical protein
MLATSPHNNMPRILIIPSKYRAKQIELSSTGNRAWIHNLIDCYLAPDYIQDWIDYYGSGEIAISPNQSENSTYDLILVVFLESREVHIPLVKTTTTTYQIRDIRHYWTLRYRLIDFELATRHESVKQSQYHDYCIKTMSKANSVYLEDSDFKYAENTGQICEIDSDGKRDQFDSGRNGAKDQQDPPAKALLNSKVKKSHETQPEPFEIPQAQPTPDGPKQDSHKDGQSSQPNPKSPASSE